MSVVLPLLLLLQGTGLSQATPVIPPVAASQPGVKVITAAHARYAGKWPKSVSWIQKTTLPDRLETWYHFQVVPGRVRVDVAPALTGRAMIFRNDSLYLYGGGKIKSAGRYMNSFFAIGADMYAMPPMETAQRLRGYGFDLSRSHETMWRGRPAIVVGANAGDLRRKQFWLDKEKLVLVRLLEPNGADPRRPLDAVILDHVKTGGGWVPGKIAIHLGGVVTQLEEFTQVTANPKYEDAWFMPGPLRIPPWVGEMADLWGKPQMMGKPVIK